MKPEWKLNCKQNQKVSDVGEEEEERNTQTCNVQEVPNNHLVLNQTTHKLVDESV